MPTNEDIQKMIYSIQGQTLGEDGTTLKLQIMLKALLEERIRYKGFVDKVEYHLKAIIGVFESIE
jgi:hypothetical protein